MSKPTQKQLAKTLLDRYDKTFADRKALVSAEKLGLPENASRLPRLTGKKDFPRLVDALVRMDVKGEREELLRSV